jgi:hypothetical protein
VRGFRYGDATGGQEQRAAAKLLSDQLFLQAGDLPLRWAAETAPGLEPVWRDRAGLDDTRIVVTPEELEHISEAMREVLARTCCAGRASGRTARAACSCCATCCPRRPTGMSESERESEAAAVVAEIPAPADPGVCPVSPNSFRPDRRFLLFWCGRSISQLSDQVTIGATGALLVGRGARQLLAGRAVVVGAVLFPAPLALAAPAGGPILLRTAALGATEFLVGAAGPSRRR